MISEHHIRELVEEKIAGTSHFVVDVKVKPTNKIKIQVDDDKNITIDDCVGISRYVESMLDREVEDFDLEVSSPGLDQPFKTIRQYKKHIGKEVRVLTLEGAVYQGILKEANDNGVIIEEQPKKKKKQKTSGEPKIINLVYDQIKETKIVISFK